MGNGKNSILSAPAFLLNHQMMTVIIGCMSNVNHELMQSYNREGIKNGKMG